MEVKPSFFSIAGFLAPGVITLFAFTLVWAPDHGTAIQSAVETIEKHKLEGAAGVVAGTVATAIFLSTAFTLGTVLSETFILIFRNTLLRPRTHAGRKRLIESLLQKKTPDELIKTSANALEAFVYISTCGLDLHWYAGRVRMVGGSGLGCLLASVYGYANGSAGIATALLVAATLSLAIGTYRSKKFDEYVAGAAATIRFIHPRTNETKED
jgi:hypothetical protein